MHRKVFLACAVLSLLSTLLLVACGGGSHNGGNQVSISISPTSATLTAGMRQQFQAMVTGTSNTSVQWQVNSIIGGNAQVGTITPTGLYTAPNPGDVSLQVTVTAVANANPAKTASAQVVVSPGIGVLP